MNKDLEYISKLEYNWNNYNAKPIPKAVLSLSQEILDSLSNYTYPYINPTANESIMLQWVFNYHLDEHNFAVIDLLVEIKDSIEIFVSIEFVLDKSLNESLGKVIEDKYLKLDTKNTQLLIDVLNLSVNINNYHGRHIIIGINKLKRKLMELGFEYV